MLMDRCLHTHNGTGGSGTLTLVSVTGYPGYDKAFPSSTRWVRYSINEYVGAAGTTALKQGESGIGSINTTTMVLTRTKVLSSWDGTTYLPNSGSGTAPSAITFGATAANIFVTCSLSVSDGLPAMPAATAAVSGLSDGLGYTGSGISDASNAVSIGTGATVYSCAEFRFAMLVSKASVRMTAATTGGTPTVLVGLYEVDHSNKMMPGKMLANFGSLGSSSVTAPVTLTSAALTTPIWINPGYYWTAFITVAGGSTGTPFYRAYQAGLNPMGISFANTVGFTQSVYASGQSALNDPATQPTQQLSFDAVMIAFS